MNLDHLVPEVMKHAAAEGARECCGLIVMQHGGLPAYRPCRNVAEGPLEFRVHPADYLRYKQEGIVAIAHTHLGSSAAPSSADLKGIESTGLPWLIVAVESGDYSITEPRLTRAPLIGRPYDPPRFDCYSLFRDWYANEGIELPEFERDDGFWMHGNDMLGLGNFELAGFKVVDASELTKGDGLVFRSKSSDLCSHLGVYLGDEVMLHHRRNQLSRREPYRGIWVSSTAYVIRHSDYAN